MKQYDLYKPNSFNSGCAFSFKIIEQDKEGNKTKPSVLVQSIKQASWNGKTKNGSFSANAKDPEKNIYFYMLPRIPLKSAHRDPSKSGAGTTLHNSFKIHNFFLFKYRST